MAGLIGIDKVVKNLAKEIKKIEGASQAGVLTAALHVRGEAQKLVPFDEGNLMASAYTVSGSVERQKGSFKGKEAGKHASDYNKAVSDAQSETKIAQVTHMPTAIIGFSAYYAVYVHEINKEYNKEGKRPQAQWKYLEFPLVRDRKKILDIIRRKAIIK